MKGLGPEESEALLRGAGRRMAESLIAELVGVPVPERCDRGERTRCCFEVALPEDTAAHQ